MALIQKSIKISQEDINYCLNLGKNLSDGIRTCICQNKERISFIHELKSMLKTEGNANVLPLENHRKNHLLKLMETEDE